LALAAVGLLALAAITYAEQRSFLIQRVDDQTSAAVPAVTHQLEPRGENPFGVGGHDGQGPDGGPGFANVPSGTYGERRNALGNATKSTVLAYFGQRSLPKPELPRAIPPGRRITVGSVGNSELRYRVLATPAREGDGTTVVAIPLSEVDGALHRLLAVEALVIGGVLAALAVLAWLLVRLGLRPLDRMGETADAIAAGDLSRRVTPADPRTEVGRLGLALNGMLAQIERAFAERQASENRLRRFLADASHELRTPLASIRGYAELFRIGAAREPAQAEKAIGRIEDQSARMGTLVEDLLTLAHLDQVPDATREVVDLSRLARDATDDARVAAPTREVSVDAPGSARVLGDQDKLRQVIGNLVRNALVHTPEGTPVEVRVHENGRRETVLEVRDHGSGLPTDDPDELFERFWRSDPGRGRGPAGAGLGLSIVAAIVHAHGGRVQAANAPGGGASFTVTLPAA
jgi:two-component system OmpR family sensor kinase